KRVTCHLLLRLGIALALIGGAAAAEQGRGAIHFDRDIRPILSANCFACHGPDAGKRKANLRLDTREGLFGSGKSGAIAATPRQPAASELLKRVASHDKEELMPPPKTGKQLTAGQIALLRRWIEEGATWSPGWTFTPPQLPPPPAVKLAAWPRGPMDHFVLSALEQRGWRPSPEADRVTLIRRLSYDLLGLPPTPKEVDAFLADTSPQAYERVVERLLASKHFGERMAQHWLDLARYADSDGYHDDYLREMHGYRDYVIGAFNRNMPFSQFTLEQLAGDLLPQPTRDQLVATAFNRNGPTTSENGADAEEYRVRYASERVSTTATVWLGLSLACAECHDHKYDPLTTRDFYRMFAFFDQVPGNPLANGPAAEPIVRIVPPGAEERLKAAEAEQARCRDALLKLYYEPRPDWDRVQTAWEQRLRDTKLEPLRFGDWRLAGPFPANAQGGDQKLPPERAQVDGDREVARHFKWETLALGETNDVKLSAGPDIIFLQRDIVTVTSALLRCRLSTNASARVWLDDRLVHESGRDAESPGAVRLFNVRVPPGRHRLLVRMTPLTGKGEMLFSARESSAHRLRLENFKANVFTIPAAQRATNDNTSVRRVFRELHFSEIDAAQATSEEAQEKLRVISQNTSRIRVMAESTNRVPTHLLMRGDFRRRGELVAPAIPAVFGSLPADTATNRLALARWLVSRENPLTARVTVNRFWQMLFGIGIVKSSEDFGAQGEPPAHPELLDWLAVRFMDNGWDVKALLREIVTSATYRQASGAGSNQYSVSSVQSEAGRGSAAKPTEHWTLNTEHFSRLRAEDPENRWLGRGARFRLPAEFIRDTALAVSGLLDRDRAPHGRSVLPYQPGPDLWKEFAFGESLKYIQDHDGELYRRGVYMFWKRSVLHPYLAVMDAPTRDVCTARRPVTNTPTQALALLNETLLVECARVLAQRVLLEEQLDDPARLRRAFRLVLARQPTEREASTLLALHADSLRHYQADIAAAKKLVSTGESARPAKLDSAQHAAWLCVCNALLNLDEMLTKE
ncbi:MAG: PSD1 and planctomycete cytochrome C domain-containing protein, partial [Limisphaerales bacterium]